MSLDWGDEDEERNRLLRMKSLKQIAGSTLGAVWKLGNRGLENRTQVLMYHSIGGHAAGDEQGLYSVTPQSFRAQMRLLKSLVDDSSIRIVPFGEFTPGALSITFDDGYKDNLTVVAPIMEDLGFPFHVFLCPAFVDSNASGFLSRRDVKVLHQSDQISLGVHGFSHTPLTTLSRSEVQTELRCSREWLQDLTSGHVVSMSYPHGAVNQDVRELVKESGFLIAASSKFGPIQSQFDPFDVSRIDIWSTDTPSTMRAKISGQWDWMKWRS